MTIEINKSPTAEWLTERVEDLWRPTELPEGLKHAASRAFLTEVGFPAVKLERDWWFDSADLPEKGMWEADPGEIFNEREGGDTSPPERFVYGLGVHQGENTWMLDGETGEVHIYEPGAWDFGEGNAGLAFATVREAAGAVAVMAGVAPRLEGEDGAAVARELIAAIREQGGEDSAYWSWVIEDLEADYLDR